jgi:hypothetical protein
MARPAKLLFTRGCKSRQGKPSWRLVADPSAREKSLVPSGVTKASVRGGSKRTTRNESEPPTTSRKSIRPKGLREAEPSMSRRRQETAEPENGGPASGKNSRRTPPGYRGRGVRTANSGTGDTLPGGLKGRRGAYKAEPKTHSAGRESDEVIVPWTARTNNLAEGRTSTQIGHGESGRSGDCTPSRELAEMIAFAKSIRVRNWMQARVVRCEISVHKITGKPDAFIGHVRFERERLP